MSILSITIARACVAGCTLAIACGSQSRNLSAHPDMMMITAKIAEPHADSQPRPNVNDINHFDASASPIEPSTGTLVEPGEIPAEWIASGQMCTLSIELYDPQQHHEYKYADWGFPEEMFRICVRRGELDVAHLDIIAGYGRVAVFGIDVNGDGILEIVLQRTVGHGNAATRDELLVYHLRTDESGRIVFDPWLALQTSGFIGGRSRGDVHPFSSRWRRVFTFRTIPNVAGLQISAKQLWSAKLPFNVADADTLTAIQVETMVFQFNEELQTYAVAGVTLRSLQESPK